ncbi:MAG: hypothetical protein KatS3mg052_1823 [Candidatus Roseilinea sp.]|nr:MAG: hypothetical protein KatS3mg052_1823 [Candidatus Roseilinea sp.]
MSDSERWLTFADEGLPDAQDASQALDLARHTLGRVKTNPQ